MSYDWEDDDIGYGRPPRWTRFEKGRSGNPNGRPKKVKDPELSRSVLLESEADRALRRELDRKIRVTDADGKKEVPMSDALVRAQVTKAAQGHVPAIRDVRKAQKELEKAEAERARIAAEEAATKAKAVVKERETTFKYICELKADQSALWSAALAEGRAEPETPWPHPDDIIIDPANRSFAIRGPLDVEHVPVFEYIRAKRDQVFLQLIVHMRERGKGARQSAICYRGFVELYDTRLPKRWGFGDEFEWMTNIYIQLPLRTLRKDQARAEIKAKLLEDLMHSVPIRHSSHYADINATMKPILKPMGYVSYAQFERAWEDTDGNPPLPRRKRRHDM